MARNKTSVEEKYNAPFPTALRALMDERGETQENIAKAAEKTRQTVSQYVNGISEPSYETLVKIADYFDVSADYLLGRTEDPNRKPCAADELGLTPAAVAYIRTYSNPARSKDMVELVRPDDCLKGLSMLIENGKLLALSREIKFFSDNINRSIEVSRVFQSTRQEEAGGEYYYKWRQAAEEDLLIKQFQKTLEEQYPAFEGQFEILFGRHKIEFQKKEITAFFDEILRQVSNYEEFKKTTPGW